VTTPRDYDVIVVGAGPAGATAAAELARGGRSVALIEKERLPRYKTCGGGLVGRALAALPACARATVQLECRAAEMHFATPRQGEQLSFSVTREEPVVAMVMRSELDAALARDAAAAGAELLAPCTARGIARPATEEGRCVELDTDRGVLRASFVIAADGARSKLAAAAGWVGTPRSLPAVEWELRVDAERHERFRHAARFDFGSAFRGYAWVFPKREHLSVGALLAERTAAPLPLVLERYLDELGLGRARSIERHGWMIPVEPRPGGPARGRVLLVGDAAGLADPLTAEGISHALVSGRLAAAAVLSSSDPARVRARYRSELRREVSSELAWARRLARVLYARRPPTWLFRHFGQTLCDALGEVISGRATYRSLLTNPRNYGRLLHRHRGGSGRGKASASSPGAA
jgi:geranylgeranyl reductase family protein